MTDARRRGLSPLGWWILFCALINAAGWTLSAFHTLNRTGYIVVFALALVVSAVWRRPLGLSAWPQIHWPNCRRRFSRFFPGAFLVLTVLAFLGGAVHPPNNYDALAYRIPRVLHWLAEGQWHWIHTDFPRLNVRGCGFEWVAAPLIAFTKTDRMLFLINVVSFLLLPGIFFSLLTRLGVRPRVAWHWMWLLPTGYCYLLQAGSLGNDLFGAVFAAAAVDFALRARASRQPLDVWLSIFAAALLGAAKASNLALLLPWAVAIAHPVRVALRRPFATALVCLVAVGASFTPTACVNWQRVGDWSGVVTESFAASKGHLVVNVANNAVLLTLQNLVPPVFPLAEAWNRSTAKIIPRGFAEKIETDFDPVGAHWTLGEMQIEEGAGLGFGVTLLLFVSVLAALRFGNGGKRTKSESDLDCGSWAHGLDRLALLVSPWLALLVLMLKSNVGCPARLAAPYYALLVPLLLAARGHERIVHARWWQASAGVVFLLALVPLVLSPARPMWPARTVLTWLRAETSAKRLVARAHEVYSVYGERTDGFRPVRERLPADANPLGFAAIDVVETSLWRPFGSRRVLHVSLRETAADLRRRGIAYVLVSADTWSWLAQQNIDSWLAENNTEVIEKYSLSLRAARGSTDWFLVKLRSPASKESSTGPSHP